MLPKTFYLKTQVAFWAGTGPLVASAEPLVAVVALAWTGGLNLRPQLGTDYRGPVHGPSHRVQGQLKVKGVLKQMKDVSPGEWKEEKAAFHNNKEDSGNGGGST